MTRGYLSIVLLGVWSVQAGASSEKTTFALRGASCKGCASATMRELLKADGVLSAHIVTPTKGSNVQAEVTYDSDTTDAGAISESMLHKGFDVLLAPWEPVAASFQGCANGSCGTRRPNAKVVAQPGASMGDEVYCPVSGVVFRISAASHKAEVNGRPVYFCCEGCARHFAVTRDRVLALRGVRDSH